MKATIVCALFLFAAVTVAQLSAGDAWQGTWSNNKRSVGGSVYICVDPFAQTAYGTYGNIGIFSGYLWGNTFSGFWYEAGYDRPFGPFQLTISGSSFSGSWSYYQGNQSYSWTGSRSSNAQPDNTQCLVPSTGMAVTGTYGDNNYVCYDQQGSYANTNQTSVSATFQNFGTVIGFSPDNGRSVSLSDFYVSPRAYEPNDYYRPENNPVKIGYSNGKNDGNSPYRRGINTRHIVIGRLVNDNEFCGFFWKGFYASQIGTGSICFRRTSAEEPSNYECQTNSIAQSSGITSWLLSQIQSAFNNLKFPPIHINVDPFITKQSIPQNTNSRTNTRPNTNTRTNTQQNTNSRTNTRNTNTRTNTHNTNSRTTFTNSITRHNTGQTSGGGHITTGGNVTSSAQSLMVSFTVLAVFLVALI